MNKLFFTSLLLLTAVLLSVGCANPGVSDPDGSPNPPSPPKRVQSVTPPSTKDTKIVYANKQTVQLNWATAEVIRTEGNTGYASLFGIIRVEQKDNSNDQSIFVEYHDGTGWKRVQAVNMGPTSSGEHWKFYFHTPEIPFNLTSDEGNEVTFAIQYKYMDQESWGFNRRKEVFRANCVEEKETPSSILGGNQILVEEATLTPNPANNDYIFEARIQLKVKKDATLDEVYLCYTPEPENPDDEYWWKWSYVESKTPPYQTVSMEKSGNTFKGYAYRDKVDEWVVKCTIPKDIGTFQFVFVEKTIEMNWNKNINENKFYMCKNRCKRYRMTPDPNKTIELKFHSTR